MPNETEVSNLHDKDFKAIVIKIYRTWEKNESTQ